MVPRGIKRVATTAKPISGPIKRNSVSGCTIIRAAARVRSPGAVETGLLLSSVSKSASTPCRRFTYYILPKAGGRTPVSRCRFIDFSRGAKAMRVCHAVLLSALLIEVVPAMHGRGADGKELIVSISWGDQV